MFKNFPIHASIFSFAMAIATALVVPSPHANGDIVLEFSDGFNRNVSFFADVGSTKTIFVFATESSPNTDLSVDGLVGFGLRANYAATSGVSSIVTANQINSAFDTDDDSFSNSTINMAGSTLGAAVKGTSVLLGQFDVSVTGLGTTVFTFDDYTTGNFADFVSAAVVNLDPIIFEGGRQFEVSISAVPEPSSMVFAVVALSYGLARRQKLLFAFNLAKRAWSR